MSKSNPTCSFLATTSDQYRLEMVQKVAELNSKGILNKHGKKYCANDLALEGFDMVGKLYGMKHEPYYYLKNDEVVQTELST